MDETTETTATKESFEEMMYRSIAKTQEMDHIVAVIDYRKKFNPKLAEACGCELKRLLVSQPSQHQEGGDVAKMLCESKNVAAIFVLST